MSYHTQVRELTAAICGRKKLCDLLKKIAVYKAVNYVWIVKSAEYYDADNTNHRQIFS